MKSNDRERFLEFLSERQKGAKQVRDFNDALSPGGEPISVPTSQPIPEGSSDEDKAARLREYERLSAMSRKKSKAAIESLDENETKSNDNPGK